MYIYKVFSSRGTPQWDFWPEADQVGREAWRQPTAREQPRKILFLLILSDAIIDSLACLSWQLFVVYTVYCISLLLSLLSILFPLPLFFTSQNEELYEHILHFSGAQKKNPATNI